MRLQGADVLALRADPVAGRGRPDGEHRPAHPVQPLRREAPRRLGHMGLEA
ncbi:MAG: hypothetical protein AVDCRST_MAG04-3172 [uncultured Acetobacteraceae bacterium]|uniref:Uncharacterized protein n=1 Tax=uncultured Acetobacteraceae bacterium TaxID=169975 RepID=A0A6J4JC79_9PROT|nr:MAG: hypothetical protein AVDCRST_MAG04-3172 [uncultured Acetobacteraceae bacterium]